MHLKIASSINSSLDNNVTNIPDKRRFLLRNITLCSRIRRNQTYLCIYSTKNSDEYHWKCQNRDQHQPATTKCVFTYLTWTMSFRSISLFAMTVSKAFTPTVGTASPEKIVYNMLTH
jgi:hypothetical protein